MVAVLAIGAEDTQLLAFSTTQRDQTGAPLLLARYQLGGVGAAAAFQSVTSVEACPPDVESPLRSTFLMINAERKRLALWEPIRASGPANAAPASGGGAGFGMVGATPTPAGVAAGAGAGVGSMAFLPAGAAAGVRTHSSVASGLVLATPRGMDFWTPGAATARLIAGAYIPRSFAGSDGTRLICFTPRAVSAAPGLDVVGVELVAPKP
jgi:hypothetical protein